MFLECNSIHYITSRWFNHQAKLPSWTEAHKLVLLVQPSSAAAERVSLLEIHFHANKGIPWKFMFLCQ